jgi:hypothetical protein
MSHKIFNLLFVMAFIIGLVVIPAPQSARAAGPWYVSTTGNDADDCLSLNTPCATINGAIGKASSGDTIYVAVGTFTGTGDQVVPIDKDITLSGGWEETFTTQSGMSTIDGQASRRGIAVGTVTAIIEHFVVKNGFSGVGGGGGIFNNGGTMMISVTTISANSAGDLCCTGGGGGGGIMNFGGIVSLNNSTVSGNTILGGFYGSGILNFGDMTINNSTISGNTGHSGIYNGNGTVTLQNSILAGNLTSGNSLDCSGMINSSGYNLIGDTSGCTVNPAIGDHFNINPVLGTFLPEQGYYPLLQGSPAIDAGNPAGCTDQNGNQLVTDQRGVARVGSCDMGAYEYRTPGPATNLSVVSGSGQRIGTNSAFSKLLQAVALDSLGSPVSGVVIDFTAPDSGPSGNFADTGTNTTSVSTNVAGIATTSIFTANNQVGNYSLVAAAFGLAGTASFAFTNALPWFVASTGDDANTCASPDSSCLTINGAIGKAGAGDTIDVALGTYTGMNSEVVLIDKSLTLSGGWNANFTTQIGKSTIDGQGARSGVTVAGNAITAIDHFIVQNGLACQGGGIHVWGGSTTLTLKNSIVRNNIQTCSGGGGGIFTDGTTTLNDSMVSDNIGGGISNGSGALTLNESIISGNINDSSGGGISNASIAILNNSTVNSNTTNYNSGGGISNSGGMLSLNNTTVSGNNAANGGGGGIYNINGTTTLKNSTIAGNTSALSYGGGIYSDLAGGGGTVNLQNTIVAGNTGYFTQDVYGDITSLGYNVIGDATNSGFTPATGDLTNVDPLLGPLQVNGGPTLTHALLPGSPAIDAGNPAGCSDQDGNPLTTDQRGVARPQGARCDIGAFELEADGGGSGEVHIDIKPGSQSNPINPKSVGKIPVAILSTSDFDAPSEVDKTSLTFGRTGDELSLVSCNKKGEDVNRDGLLDLVCQFKTKLTGFKFGDTEGILKGQTVDGVPIEGRDSVNVVR